MMEMEFVELKKRIAGEIAISKDPGATMKKWREIFGISQVELASFLGITPSTVSDYENNRRKSPGIHVIKRFIDAMIELDKRRGGQVLRRIGGESEEKVYEIHEFAKPLIAREFVRAIEGMTITNKRRIGELYIYGYSIVDSLKAIVNLSVDDFYKIYGPNPAVAVIFTGVKMGRSPMVAIRVSRIKPSLVVYQGLSSVKDPLAKKISEVEKIPIVLTRMDMDRIRSRLKKFEV